MRQHKKMMLSVLDGFSNKEDQLQIWSDYHQRQMNVFASDRLMLVIVAGLSVVLAGISLGFGLSLNNFGLVFLAMLSFFGGVATIYYLLVLCRLFNELSDLSLKLQEQAIKMKTKPVQTVLNRILEMGGAFLNQKIREWKNND